jgi:hypothetical protein
MNRMRRGPRPATVVTALVTLALALSGGSLAAQAAPVIGNDVSWPQCGRPLPAGAAFGIVGVNDGKPFTDNPCLVAEYQWAAATGLAPGLYINTSNPGTQSEAVDWYSQRSPNAACSRANAAACAYDYGYNGARQAYAFANARVAAGPGHTWWLDVETGNSWSGDLAANLADIAGAIDYLASRGVVVGVYSTRYQWSKITGGASIPGLPNWVAGATDADQASRFCSTRSFTGGPVLLVQFVQGRFDYDVACPGSDAVLRPRPAPQPDLLTSLLQALGLLPKAG